MLDISLFYAFSCRYRCTTLIAAATPLLFAMLRYALLPVRYDIALLMLIAPDTMPSLRFSLFRRLSYATPFASFTRAAAYALIRQHSVLPARCAQQGINHNTIRRHAIELLRHYADAYAIFFITLILRFHVPL